MPPWVERAAAYELALPADAPTGLRLRAPALADVLPPVVAGAAPRRADTALAFLGRALSGALRPDDDGDAFDEELLERFMGFGRLFGQGVESLELRESRTDGAVLHLTQRGLQGVERLRARIPGPRRVRLAGRPAAHGHGLPTFALRLGTGESLPCVPVSPVAPEVFAAPVAVVSGLARFRPSGRVLRVDAERVVAGSERDAQLWQTVPRPMNGVMMVRETRRTQWPGTGLNAAFGSWTDDLDDDEVLRMLEELS